MPTEDIAATSNVRALLNEVATRLGELAERGADHSIDLRGLPLAPDERDALRAALGRGEITVRLDALGESEVYETSVAGVWWVIHRDEAGEPAAELIEIALQPAMLASHPADVARAHAALRQRFGSIHEST